eukprot:CAMPEP_0118691100 /NCGR_PEP_ID=MMETSP0800-20121206/10489_1 /TAXON_ID=210618 ORGANISM="Striatella unipunctata, Strain CCMP2910" /NCGR_SAMPLE_ID=MMETSP0800 /ASSEMBLY_ACC=CAM_ASM_000638 /LENGTH=231 /DNA_ID=CAMNT_0006588835 /DNA_START=168 /DNA_END=863 /DNA_ORIENTATION=+
MTRRSGMADRDPCPWRIVDDVGGAFAMGGIGSAVWNGVKGSWISPRGSKLQGSMTAMAARSPVLGGQFAVWGGVFACCDCTLTAIRQKEDPWNSIVSGAATGGILAARAGPRAVASAAVVGGVLLALIEGMGIMISKAMAPPVPTAEDYANAMKQNDPTAPPTTGGGLYPAGVAGMFAPPTSSSSPSSFENGTTDTTTTFSREPTQGDDTSSGSSSGGGGGWWPFGSQTQK